MIRRRTLIILIPAFAVAAMVIAYAMSGPAIQEAVRGAIARHIAGTPHPPRLLNPVPLPERLSERGFALGQPVVLRLFKEESVLELWMERDGRFEHALSYAICAWSGALGPKLREGDRQSPEGFYLVSRKQLKPDSSFYRALNVGFPNAYDRALGRTGSFLMIHGDCVSIGCYAMTDAGMDDIYSAVEQALDGGQKAVPVQIFPFRMTEENLARHGRSEWSGFWRNLAEGDRLFLESGKPPRAYACGGRYAFVQAGDPQPPSCRVIAAW